MSFLSSIAPALGGIGQGVTQGLNALNQQEQQKFQKEQQDRLRQSWQDLDATNAQLKGIPTTTPDQWETGYEAAKAKGMATRDYEGNLIAGAKAGTARPTQDILADQARIYMNSTDPKNKALGLQLAEKATQLSNQARQQAVLDKYKEPFAQISTPTGAANWLDTQGIPIYNAEIPDGHKVSAPDIQANGSRTYHIFDDKNNLVSSHTVRPDEMQNLASKHLRGLIDTELGVIDPTGYKDWYTRQNDNERLGISRISAQAQQQSAQAQQQNAQTEASRWTTGGVMERMQKDLLKSHEEVARLNRISQKDLNPLQQTQLDRLKSQVADETEFTKLLNDPINNYAKLKSLATQMGVRHPEATENKVIHHANGDTEYVPVNKYMSRAIEAFQNAGGHEINSQDHNVLTDDAKLAKGNQSVFLQSPSAKAALAKGIPVATLLDEFMPNKVK